MTEVWLIETLKGIGKIFLHPLFYYLMFISILIGAKRVKRERSQFHTRVNDGLLEWRSLLKNGLLIGLVISIIMLVTGVIVPFAAIILFSIMTVVLSFTTKIRLLTPAYIVGFAFFALIIIANNGGWPFQLFEQAFTSLDERIFPSIAVLLGLLLVSEAILIFKNGGKNSSPKLVKGKRGMQVGVHEVRCLWMVPVLLLVPGGVLQAPFPWWPVFSIGENSYSLLLIPFAVGYFQQCNGMLPKVAAQLIGTRLLLVGVITTAIAVSSYYYPLTSIVAVTFAIIFREIIYLRHRIYDDSLPTFFTKRNNGLKILGIIPQSPAHKMGLQIGESIMKVNGVTVQDELSFYKAIQRNSAHCKLEVANESEEIRFVQRALYEGNHHELGVLFVQGGRKWNETRMID